MKKEKLLKLYELIKEWCFIPVSNLEGVKGLSDEEIDLILHSKYKKMVFNYLTTNLINDELRVQIANIINNATSETGAMNAVSIANIASIYYHFEKEKYLELVELASKNNTMIAPGFKEAIINDELIKDNNTLYEIIKAIVMSKDFSITEAILMIPKNNEIVHRKLTGQLVKIISQAKGNYQAGYAAKIAINPVVLNSNHIIELTEAATKVDDLQKVVIDSDLYNELTDGANDNKRELGNLFDINVNTDFWKLFANDSKEAMKLLDEMKLDDQHEITSDMKVKVKVKLKNN